MARCWTRCCVAIVLLWASVPASAADDSEPIVIDTVPYRVRVPGSYRLASDLTYTDASGVAISIEADDVRIDLRGHALIGTAGAGSGAVGIRAVDRKRVSITKGRIAGFYFGIDIRSDDRAGGTSSGHQVSRMVLDGNWYFGVRLVGSDSEIVGCTITSTGGSARPGHTIPHGIRFVGERNLLTDCCVRDLVLKRHPDGRGEIVGVHFDAARGSRMEHNTIVEVSNDRDDPFPDDDDRERRFGVWVNGGPRTNTFLTVKDNTISGFAVPLAFTPGTDGLVEGNTFAGASDSPIRGRPAAQLAENRVVEQTISVDCPATE